MRAILGRELDVIARQPAYVIGLMAHVVCLGVFVLAWGDGRGVPIMRNDFYFQVRLVQAVFLIWLLPWTAARCLATERGDDLVMMSAMTAVRPSRLMLARTTAALIALAVVVVAGLPVVMLARQISMTPLWRVARDEAAMMAIAAVASSVVLVCRYIFEGRLAGWLAAAVATPGIAAAAWLLLGRPGAIAPALTAAAGVAALLLAAQADTTLRYLRERA